MTESHETRLTLPPYLIDRIRNVLIPNVAKYIDEALRTELQAALTAVDTYRPDETDLRLVDGKDDLGDVNDGKMEDQRGKDDADEAAAPPTVREDTLERLSRWAQPRNRQATLKRNGLGEWVVSEV